MQLWLVRHGESLGNLDGSQSDSALSPAGEAQARALAPLLAKESFSLVLSSPLLRARQTAELALPARPATPEPRLRELVVPSETFLDSSALGPEQLRELLDRARAETGPRPETGRAFIERVSSWLDALPSQLELGARVLAFTHFAVIRECLRLSGVRPLPQRIEHCVVHRLELPRSQ